MRNSAVQLFKRIHWPKRLVAGLGMFAILIGFGSASIQADVFNGVEVSSAQQITSSFSPGVTTGTINFLLAGGDGTNSQSMDLYGSEIVAMLFGNTTGSPATPLLKSKSASNAAGEAARGFAGAMATYQYNGAVEGLVNFDWLLTAVLTEPPGTAAFVSGRAGFVSGATVFDTSINNFAESPTPPLDSMSSNWSDAGIVNETGTISFLATPGQQFSLIMSLLTYGGEPGAIADASSTFTGTLSSPTGSINAVPEPTSAGIGAVFGLAVLIRRRRRRNH